MGLDVSKVFYKSNFRDCHKISFMIDISVGWIRKDSLSKIPLLRSILPFFWIQILEYHSFNRAVFNHNTSHTEDAGWQLFFFLLFTNITIKAWFKIYPGKKFLKCSPMLGCKTALFWPTDVYELWFKLCFEQNTYLQKITLELY